MTTYKEQFDQKVKLFRLLDGQRKQLNQMNSEMSELLSMLNFTEQQLSEAHKTITALQSPH